MCIAYPKFEVKTSEPYIAPKFLKHGQHIRGLSKFTWTDVYLVARHDQDTTQLTSLKDGNRWSKEVVCGPADITQEKFQKLISFADLSTVEIESNGAWIPAEAYFKGQGIPQIKRFHLRGGKQMYEADADRVLGLVKVGCTTIYKAQIEEILEFLNS